MSRRQVKKQLTQLLATGEKRTIEAGLDRFSPFELINPLFSALCSISSVERWYAIYSFGRIVPRIADEEMESARIVMRRFLWSLNDESGGIGWGAPEAMGEIMACDDRLSDEFLHMLISYTRGDGPLPFEDGNYLELPMLQRGLLWGIGRLCEARTLTMQNRGVGKDMFTYLTSEDLVVRSLAVKNLGLLGDPGGTDVAGLLLEDPIELELLMDGRLITTSTAELANQYLVQFSGSPDTGT